MERKDYLRYIAHYITYVSPLVPNVEYRAYLQNRFKGKSFGAAALEDAKAAAHHLYASYVASIYSRYDAWYLAKRLDTKGLAKFIDAEIDVSKAYGVLNEPIDRSLKPAHIDTKIKELSGSTGYEKTLTEIMEDAPAKAPRKKSSPKKKRSPKKAAAGTTKKSTKKSEDRVVVMIPAKPKKEAAGKSTKKEAETKGSKSSSTKSTASSKRCKEYLVADLKKMATDQKIVGRGTMNKSQLCAALGIKE